MIRSNLEGVEFVVANTDAQALQHRLASGASSSARPHPGLGRRRPARGRPRGRRGGDATRSSSSCRLPHGLHHRRHGRRHRHRRGAGDRPGRPRAGHPDRRRRDQALPLRGRAPHAAGRDRHRRAAEVRRHADHHPEPEPVPHRQRAHHLRRRLQDGRRRAALRRARRHRPDGHAGPDQPRLRRHPDGDERDGQGDDGHRRGEGERRAIEAAEAAISNPLLDEYR